MLNYSAQQVSEMMGQFCQFNNNIISVCMVKDDLVYLKYWLRHYKKELPDCPILIIDHGSSPPLKSLLSHDDKVAFIDLPPTPFDDQLRALGVSYLVNFLHSFFGTVIFSDVDELVMPDKRKYSNLQDFILKNKILPSPLGIDVIHDINTEKDFDWAGHIGSQRQYVCASGCYSKSALTSGGGVVYSAGFHKKYPYHPISSELFLFHFQKMDKKTYLNRYTERLSVQFSTNQIKSKLGSHWKVDLNSKIKYFDSLAIKCKKAESVLNVEQEAKRLNETIHRNPSGCYGPDIKYISDICIMPDFIKCAV